VRLVGNFCQSALPHLNGTASRLPTLTDARGGRAVPPWRGGPHHHKPRGFFLQKSNIRFLIFSTSSGVTFLHCT
jgi:hypothetical protein